MNCRKCIKEAKLICKTCIIDNIYCFEHAEEHSKISDHVLNMYSKEFIQRKSQHIIKSEIKKCIAQISSEVSSVISKLKEISKETIKTLKESSRNLESFKDFKPVTLNKEKISMIFQEIGPTSGQIEKKELSKDQSNCQTVFANMEIEDKIKYAKDTWDLTFSSPNTIELLLSNDELLLFECTEHVGKK